MSLSVKLMSFSPWQGDRLRRGEPHEHPECGHRVWAHAAAAGDGGVELGGPHGLPKPDSGAYTVGVREHFRQVNPAAEDQSLFLFVLFCFVFFFSPHPFILARLRPLNTGCHHLAPAERQRRLLFQMLAALQPSDRNAQTVNQT